MALKELNELGAVCCHQTLSTSPGPRPSLSLFVPCWVSLGGIVFVTQSGDPFGNQGALGRAWLLATTLALRSVKATSSPRAGLDKCGLF